MGGYCKDCGTKRVRIPGCWGSDSEYEECERCRPQDVFLIVNNTKEECFKVTGSEEDDEDPVEKLIKLLKNKTWSLDDKIFMKKEYWRDSYDYI